MKATNWIRINNTKKRSVENILSDRVIKHGSIRELSFGFELTTDKEILQIELTVEERMKLIQMLRDQCSSIIAGEKPNTLKGCITS